MNQNTEDSEYKTISLLPSNNESDDDESQAFDEEFCGDIAGDPIQRCIYFLETKTGPLSTFQNFSQWFLENFDDIEKSSPIITYNTLTKLLQESQIPIQDYPEICNKVYLATYQEINQKKAALKTLTQMVLCSDSVAHGKEGFFETIFEQSCCINSEILPRVQIWELIAAVLYQCHDITIDPIQVKGMLQEFHSLKSKEKKELMNIICAIVSHDNKDYAFYSYCTIREEIIDIIQEWSEVYVIESMIIVTIAVSLFDDSNEIMLLVLEEIFNSDIFDFLQ